MEQTGQVVLSAERYAQEHCGCGIEPILSSKIRKEDLAHKC